MSQGAAVSRIASHAHAAQQCKEHKLRQDVITLITVSEKFKLDGVSIYKHLASSTILL